jgi:flagellar biosynthetic protein FliR
LSVGLDAIALNWPLLRGFARGCGFAALVPTLGLGGLRTRVLLTVLLSLIISTADRIPASQLPHDEKLLALLVELAIGLVLGFTLRVVVSAVRTVAQLVEQQVGLPAFDNSDPENASPLGRLYPMTALVLFLCTAGHRAVVSALLSVPEATAVFASDAMVCTELLVRLVTAAWLLVVQSAFPLVVSLLSIQIAGAMIARVVPQFGASEVAAPVQVVVGLVLIALSLATVSVSFGHGLGWSASLMRSP